MQPCSFKERILDLVEDAKTVFIFVSKHDEVDTKQTIETLLDRQKQVVVPVVAGDSIIPSRISSIQSLRPRTFGIPEPLHIRPVPISSIDIFFVPGTKFDHNGQRKGRGHGYFDRFLQEIKGKKPIIGLCHAHQLVDWLPTQPWDIPVDEIVVKE